jgi:hypothetical protein
MMGGPQVTAAVSSGFGGDLVEDGGHEPLANRRPRRVRVDGEDEVAALSPCQQVFLIAKLGVAARAGDDRDVVIVLPLVEHEEDERAQGREADADEEIFLPFISL